MDYLLHRCSGSTFCHYTKRFQHGCLSVLRYYGLVPSVVPKKLSFNYQFLPRQNALLYNKWKSSLFLVSPVSLRHVYCSSVRLYGAEPTTSGEKKSDTKRLVLPSAVVERLQRLESLASSHLDSSGASEELDEITRHYFRKGGKLIRPTVALLMAGACSAVTRHQRSTVECDEEILFSQEKIAVISEMIHAASLIHDDVIDEAESRRNRPTINCKWGNKKIIEDLVRGEFMQLRSADCADERFSQYVLKTFKKTASLFANSCKAVAILAPDSSVPLQTIAFEYGRHLGMAFQLVDDLLDFVARSSVIGKPVAADLKLGIATAPVLFAVRQHKELEPLIVRRFSEKGDVERALKLVLQSDGPQETRTLATTHSKEAIRQAKMLPHSPFSEALLQLPVMQLERTR